MRLDLNQRPGWAAALLLSGSYDLKNHSLPPFTDDEQLELARLVTHLSNAKLAHACALRDATCVPARKLLVSFAVEHADEEIGRELLTTKPCYEILTFAQKQKLFQMIVRSDKIVHLIEMLFCHGKHIPDAEKAAFIRGLLRRNSRKLACDALNSREIYKWLNPRSAPGGWALPRVKPPEWLLHRQKLLREFVPVAGYDWRIDE